MEKPLALTDEQLAEILATVERTGNSRLMVGFNRRFAPLFTDLRERFGRSSRWPRGTWSTPAAWTPAAGTSTRSARDRGSPVRAGHFIDTLSALVESDPVEVYAVGTGGDVHATLRFANESVAASPT